MNFRFFSKKKRIFLDYASLAPMHPDVSRCMSKYTQSGIFNSEALYKEGVETSNLIKEIKSQLWSMYSVHADEIIFTESGTLSNNLAIQGVVRNAKLHGIEKPHIIISSIEHSSVFETVKFMVASGEIDADVLHITKEGTFNEKECKLLLRSETVLVSCMYVNNETGLILPVYDIEKIVRHYRKEKKTEYPYFHSDCAQAMYLPIDMRKFHVDLLTISGSKMFGGQGVSVLYKRRGVTISPIIHGGDGKQLWSGTKNCVALSAFSKTLELWTLYKAKWRSHCAEMSEYLRLKLDDASKLYKDIIIISNSEHDKNSPHIFTFGFMGVSGERLVLMLDAKGIMVSSRSACKTNEEGVSHVIKSFYEESLIDFHNIGMLRISFSFQTKVSDIDTFVSKLMEVFKLIERERELIDLKKQSDNS